MFYLKNIILSDKIYMVYFIIFIYNIIVKNYIKDQ